MPTDDQVRWRRWRLDNGLCCDLCAHSGGHSGAVFFAAGAAGATVTARKRERRLIIILACVVSVACALMSLDVAVWFTGR